MSLASYYRRFVKKFTFITTHMEWLTHKEVSFIRLDKFEESFQKLKTFLAAAPILLLPVEGKNFVVFCDDSYLGLVVVLMQERNAISYNLR